MTWAAATALLWAAASPGQVIWHVDDDVCPGAGAGTEAKPFCRIQEALAAAADGDTIRVAPGVYVENLNYLGKAVEVESVGGAAGTTVRADRPDRVVRVAPRSSVTVRSVPMKPACPEAALFVSAAAARRSPTVRFSITGPG